MRKFKAYTLLEMLIVITIMVILMGVGYSAYASFTETTKFNQDVADLQSDIIIIQRATMLLERDPTENWLYGIGIDFEGIRNGTGEYTFFKWCSEYPDFGMPKTKGRYPGASDESDPAVGNGFLPGYGTNCNGTTEALIHLQGYDKGVLNLKERVSIVGNARYLLFEAVSGRAFVYADSVYRELLEDDIVIQFDKNFGLQKQLTVENLTGRTKVLDYSSP